MNSVLEVFWIMFKSDASDLDKGAKKAKQSTDNLNSSLKSADSWGKNVGLTFKKLASQFGGFVASILGFVAIVRGINSSANFSDKLDELSKSLNVNIEDLSAWGDAVKMSGGTAEGFQDTVRFMTASLADFATKGKSRAAPFFQALGISMTDAQGRARSFIDILPEIADSFQNLSRAESLGIGQKMGLDPGTIMLLQQGRKEVEALIKRQKELGVVTKEDAEIAAKFNDQWDDTAHAFRTMFQMVGSSVLPAFTAILKGIEHVALFFRKHSSFITGALIALGAAILFFVVPPLYKLAAAAIIAFAPFILIGAAVAALAIAFAFLYDEFYNFFNGHKSVIGDIVAKWPIVGKIIYGIVDIFKALWTVVKLVFGAINFGVQAMGEGLKHVGIILNHIIDFIIDAIKGIGWFLEKMSSAADAVQSFFGFGGSENKKTTTNLNTAQNALNLMGTSPLASQTSNSISNRNSNKSTNVQTGPISIVTQANDPAGIAGAIGNSLENQMRQVVNNYDDGVMA